MITPGKLKSSQAATPPAPSSIHRIAITGRGRCGFLCVCCFALSKALGLPAGMGSRCSAAFNGETMAHAALVFLLLSGPLFCWRAEGEVGLGFAWLISRR